MDDSNLSDLPSFPGYGHSRLMSESPLPRGSSLDNRDLTDADLSLSELSVAEPPRRLERFSLLAPRQQDSHHFEEGDSLFSDVAEEPEIDEDEDDEGDEEHTAKREQDRRVAAQTREDKLRSDIFILRKLNSAFTSFNDALQETTSANQRIAAQLAHTDALLNRYIEILSKSDKYSHLIFDEQWEGAEEDELVLERERLAEIERKKKEAEERERARLAAKLEEERRRKEEEEERLRQEELQKAAAAAKPGRGTGPTRTAPTRSRAGSRIGSVGGTTRGRVATSSRGTASTRGSTTGTTRASSSTSSRLTR